MQVKIVIGLGNSGAEYEHTRHNAGRIAVAEVARLCGAVFLRNKSCAAHVAKASIESFPIMLAFADGYMNFSGESIGRILRFFKFDITETAVVYDDITLDAGRMKLSVGGSSGGHNGVADIISKCGDGFARIRLGVGAKPLKSMDLADYVLGRLDESQLEALKSLDVRGCIGLMLSKGLEGAQNVVNRKSP